MTLPEIDGLYDRTENKAEDKRVYNRIRYYEKRDFLLEQKRKYGRDNPERVRALRRANHYKNREKINERQRKYYAENTERVKAGVRRNYEAKREEICAHNRQYYLDNRDVLLAYQRNRRQEMPEHYRAIGQMRYAKRKAAGDIDTAAWKRLLAEFNGRCAYCDEPADLLEPDHVHPIVLGGTSDIFNILPACMECNRGAGGKWKSTLQEWRPELYEKYRVRLDLCSDN
jgi:hypothetical protein